MNLVNELQVSAENDDVLTVLRKTKRLASKLDRQDIAEWLNAEQNGYANGQPVPEYRSVGMSLALKTNGYVPAGFGRIMNGVQELSGIDLGVPARIDEPISTVMSMIESLNQGSGIYRTIPRGSDLDKAVRGIVNLDPMFAHQVEFLCTRTRRKSELYRIKSRTRSLIGPAIWRRLELPATASRSRSRKRRLLTRSPSTSRTAASSN